MADPVVHLTNGLPDSGTGNVTTLGQTLLDGANITIGALADAAVAAGAAGSASAKLRSISRDVVGGVVLQPGTNVIGHVIVDTAPTTAITAAALPLPALAATSTKQSDGTQKTQVVDASGNVQPSGDTIARALFEKITDGTNTAAVKAASTAPVATDPAMVVAISPNSVNANGRALPAASAPVVMNSMTYSAKPASSTAALFGATGASGDYLDGVLIIPAAAAAGVVSITDGGGSAITIFAGGGTTALPTLAPFYVPIGAVSSGGAGGWKVTTGTNVSVIGIGNFT